MKERYKLVEDGVEYQNLDERVMKNVNTYGAWSNREEEWFFNNKRFLFSTKTPDVRDMWIEKLSALITDP